MSGVRDLQVNNRFLYDLSFLVERMHQLTILNTKLKDKNKLFINLANEMSLFRIKIVD